LANWPLGVLATPFFVYNDYVETKQTWHSLLTTFALHSKHCMETA
jgi:hypothetical protein